MDFPPEALGGFQHTTRGPWAEKTPDAQVEESLYPAFSHVLPHFLLLLCGWTCIQIQINGRDGLFCLYNGLVRLRGGCFSALLRSIFSSARYCTSLCLQYQCFSMRRLGSSPLVSPKRESHSLKYLNQRRLAALHPGAALGV